MENRISQYVPVNVSDNGITQEKAYPSGGNFTPVEVSGGKTEWQAWREQAISDQGAIDAAGVKTPKTPGIDKAMTSGPVAKAESLPVLGKGYPGADFLNSMVTIGAGNVVELATKPLGIETGGMDYKDQLSKEHPVAAIVAGTAPFIATAPLFPASLAGLSAQFATVSGLSEVGRQRIDESLTKPFGDKALDVAKETSKGALMGPIWHYSGALEFIGRPFASALVKAGVRGVGTASLDKVYGADLSSAFKDGGTITALSLIFENPFLANTSLGRGVIADANKRVYEALTPGKSAEIEAQKPLLVNPIKPDASPDELKRSILDHVNTLSNQIDTKEQKPSEHEKFLTPPEEPKIVNPETIKGMGEEGKMDISMLPGVPEAAELVQKAHTDYVETLKPMDASSAAKVTAQELRKNIGEMVRSHDQFEASMRGASKIFEKASKESINDSYTRAERGEKQDNPELQPIYDTLQKTMLDKAEQVRDLGTGKLEDLIENYLPHVWEKPGKAKTTLSKFFGKKPLEGSKSFLKQRIIGDFSKGVEAGLEPVSWNPVDLTMIKLREMDKYIMAHKTLNVLKEQGIMKFVKIGGEIPEDFKKVNDSLSDVYSRGPNGELILRGRWYGQKDAVRIIDNYLSPGLQGKFVYDLYRGAGNTLNQFQLGFSAFHLGFTSMDATISKFALGFNKLAAKDLKGAVAAWATAPAAPVTNAMKGFELRRAWAGLSNDPLMNKIAELMAQGGGRAKMDKFYATGMRESMAKALKEGKIASVALKTPMWIVEQVSRPIMEHIVPWQKAGVFHDLMKFELERNPTMTHAQMVDKAQKIWDSVDNRMGQMVYDNLFWNKTVKDIGMAGVRSLGWNLGTVREIGGGLKDVPMSIKGLAKGEGMSYRTAYIMALPMITALYGAMYQYAATGKGPQEPRDYWFPKNGGIDKDGNPSRVSLPTYMKDIYHYITNPTRTLINKLSPVNNMIADMLTNKDFYGTQIVGNYDNEDPNVKLYHQALDETKFVVSQFTPFAVSNLDKSTKKDTASKIQPFIGITPAPYDVGMTKAERMASELTKGKIPLGARTKEKAEHSKTKNNIRNEYFATKDIAPVLKAVKDGTITPKEKREIVKESKMSGLQRSTNHLSYEEVQSIYAKATDKEKVELDKILRKKKTNKQRAGTWTKDEESLFKKHFGY